MLYDCPNCKNWKFSIVAGIAEMLARVEKAEYIQRCNMCGCEMERKRSKQHISRVSVEEVQPFIYTTSRTRVTTAYSRVLPAHVS